MKHFFAKFCLMSLIAAVGLLQCIPSSAEDAVVAFTNARNAFDSGDYREAATRFQSMIDDGLDNEALLLETHKYLGVCYIFLADEKNAEEQFVKLLNMDPGFKLDPLVFPIDVVDFFTSVQRKHAIELEKIAADEARAEAARKKAEERQRLEEIDRLRTNVYVQKEVKLRSKLVAAMPLGAGQFQNGHYRRGIIFLSGELVLAAASIVTWSLHENLRSKSAKVYSRNVRQEYERQEKIYRVTNRSIAGALGVMILAGIVDSIYHFKQQTAYWRKIDENQVPDHLRKKKKSKNSKPQASLMPWFGSKAAGLGAACVF